MRATSLSLILVALSACGGGDDTFADDRCGLPDKLSLERLCEDPKFSELCEGRASYEQAIATSLQLCSEIGAPVKVSECEGLDVIEQGPGLSGAFYAFDPDSGELVGIYLFSDGITECPEDAPRQLVWPIVAGRTPQSIFECRATDCTICGDDEDAGCRMSR